MTLRPQDVQAAELDHLVVLLVRHRLEAGDEVRPILPPFGVGVDVSVVHVFGRTRGRPLGRLGIDPLFAVLLGRPAELFAGHELRVAAQQNIGAAARHVGRNGDGPDASGLRHNQRLAFVLLGVQDVVLDLALLEDLDQPLGRALDFDEVVDEGQELFR